MKNYLKIKGARKPEHFFLFDDSSPEEFAEAVEQARKVQPGGYLVVGYPLKRMPNNLRCVGHSPYIHGASKTPGFLTQKCQFCAQDLPEIAA